MRTQIQAHLEAAAKAIEADDLAAAFASAQTAARLEWERSGIYGIRSGTVDRRPAEMLRLIEALEDEAEVEENESGTKAA